MYVCQKVYNKIKVEFDRDELYKIEIGDGGGCGFTIPNVERGDIIDKYAKAVISHH